MKKQKRKRKVVENQELRNRYRKHLDDFIILDSKLKIAAIFKEEYAVSFQNIYDSLQFQFEYEFEDKL